MQHNPPEHCGQPMGFYTVGAPGTGCGWYCEVCQHQIPTVPTRILTPEETV